MIFSDSPSQKALERMMTQVKGFPPRGSGVMVLRRFEYTAEMCDCRLCLYYNRKKKCTVSQCPCIEERIVAGAADRSEVMAETMKNIHNAAFHRRLNQFINESEELHMNFRNEKHRLAFVEAIRKLDKKNFALMSALYLLTAEHMYSTDHGVKGEEYDNVLLVMGRGWNLYKFEDILWKEESQLAGNDLKAYIRNRNLFYVCCSRPRKRLAILITVPISDQFRNYLNRVFGTQNVIEYTRFIKW